MSACSSPYSDDALRERVLGLLRDRKALRFLELALELGLGDDADDVLHGVLAGMEKDEFCKVLNKGNALKAIVVPGEKTFRL